MMTSLRDSAKTGDPWKGAVRLGEIKPGIYQLVFEVKSRRAMPEIVGRLATDLRVIKGPFDK